MTASCSWRRPTGSQARSLSGFRVTSPHGARDPSTSVCRARIPPARTLSSWRPTLELAPGSGGVDMDLSGSVDGVDVAGPRPHVGGLEDAVRDLRAPLVRRLALIVGDVHEAEDLAQATFAKAVEAWASFDGRDVRAWLFTIGIRRALDEVRRRRRH